MKRYLYPVLFVLLLWSAMLVGCGGTAAPAPGEAPAASGGEGAAEQVEAGSEEAAPASGEKVQIRWFVGLGTGGNPEQLEAQEKVRDAFNASHPDIELVLEVVQNEQAYDTLQTQIAAGNPPDIVGPVGVRGLNGFRDRILDLSTLIEESGYDTSDYEPALVDFWKQNGKQVGLPFAVYPSFLYFNRELFDEADLPYPPQDWGAEYEGKPWNMAALRELAMKLTVDANGNDATSPDFDPENIVQFGFVPQWGDDPRAQATFFGAGSVVDEAGNAQVPAHWQEAWKWHYDGMWKDHFIPTSIHLESDLFPGGNAFGSGNVAMAFTHLWFTCCIDPEIVSDWDIAAIPAYNGEVTAKLHADTFVILDSTAHPEEAFEVYEYLLNEAELDLLAVYGGLPAHESKQESFFESLDEKFAPNEVNWQVAIDALAYPDNPSHEADMPDFLRADDVIKTFGTLYHSTPGLDMDGEIQKLQQSLQAVFTNVQSQ